MKTFVFAKWSQCVPPYIVPLPPAPVSLHSSGIRIRSSVFVGLTVVTNSQTDHATCVATGRIFAICIAMRPKNYSERQNCRHQFREQHEQNASSLLLAATAHARCVFVHVAVSVRLPSPRALRRNAYIYRTSLCDELRGDCSCL